jgi:hypothetical protein
MLNKSISLALSRRPFNPPLFIDAVSNWRDDRLETKALTRVSKLIVINGPTDPSYSSTSQTTH